MLFDWVFMTVPCGFAAPILSVIIGAVVFDTDFDGPSQHEALGKWVLFTTWCALALAYTAVEAFGGIGFGKAAAQLRIVVPAARRRRRLVGRWVVAYLPLVLMTGVCAAGVVHTEVVGYEAFEEVGHRPDGRLLAMAVALAAAWAAGFCLAAGGGRQTFAERVTGVEVLRQVPLWIKDQGRGFDVVPAPTAPTPVPPP